MTLLKRHNRLKNLAFRMPDPIAAIDAVLDFPEDKRVEVLEKMVEIYERSPVMEALG